MTEQQLNYLFLYIDARIAEFIRVQPCVPEIGFMDGMWKRELMEDLQRALT